MTNEQQFFLDVLKDYIHETKTKERKDIDWSALLRYAESHQLTAIVYSQCKNFLPEECANLYKRDFLNTVYTNVQRKSISEDILAKLRENKVNCFLVKGAVVADFYPDWHHRTMGDTDIVVNDMEKAHEILVDNGFQNISKLLNREYQYSKKNLEFELHDRLVYDEAINLDKTTDFFNNYHGYANDNKFDNSFHFLFVLNHLRKHFMNSGVGFRMFLDIALLIKNDSDLNWTWIEEQLEAIDLMAFAKNVFCYIERWFGVVAPIPCAPVSEETFESSTQYIFANGIFGFDNADNKDYLSSNEIRKSKNKKIGMLKLAIRRAFPSYQSMCSSEVYSFLRGKPFLLPFAWTYRFVRKSKNDRFKEGKKLLADSFVSEEYITQREEMFKNWGLSNRD